jgi:hypothetical protein
LRGDVSNSAGSETLIRGDTAVASFLDLFCVILGVEGFYRGQFADHPRCDLGLLFVKVAVRDQFVPMLA